ncbi:hypothetical protein [Micromonospora sp. NPDC093277]|uniref:hypothetical protein n=1 Tax=Micromonospora sp. NPDC093277 TaxID=3364291 RepID=UPI00382FB259
MKHRRAKWIAGGCLFAALAVGMIFIAIDNRGEPRARQYGSFTSCLLTDQDGIGGVVAAPVWSGMQDASLATLTKIQYLSVIGAQTTDNAGTFVASLVQSQCDLVILAGEVPVSAAGASSGRFPEQRFVAVGDQPGETRSNLTWLTGSPETLRGKVDDVVRGVAREGRR